MEAAGSLSALRRLIAEGFLNSDRPKKNSPICFYQCTAKANALLTLARWSSGSQFIKSDRYCQDCNEVKNCITTDRQRNQT